MIKLCANGTKGYRVKADELQEYSPRNPCSQPATLGHIHCTACRLEAAGTLPLRRNSETLAAHAE